VESYRRFYADEIRLAANLRSTELVKAFATVPRARYLGPPPWNICSSDRAGLGLLGIVGDPYITTENPRDLYHNVLVAIDATRQLNNGHPSTLAYWIEALDLRRGDRVYHAGCGVGYYTAILAEMVGEQGSVVAIDLDPDLAERARRNLSAYSQVSVHAGDGADFDPGPCDAMLINAGATHPCPLWLDRLTERGRMVIPLTAKGGENFGTGIMAKVSREPFGFSAVGISFVAIFSFSTLRDPEIEPLLGKALASRALLKLKSLRFDKHDCAETCIVHTARICLSSAALLT
jgi:protein-L-isoaspartate(D-aspartate) O-methyltransferase